MNVYSNSIIIKSRHGSVLQTIYRAFTICLHFHLGMERKFLETFAFVCIFGKQFQVLGKM